MKTPSSPTLTDRCRGLLEAVMGVLGLEQGRSGVLAGPLALLMWFRTRRMRKEVEAFADQFRGLMEQLLAMLEAYKAGTLSPALPSAPVPSPPGAPQGERAEAEPRTRRNAPKRRQLGDSAEPRSPAPSAVDALDHEETPDASPLASPLRPWPVSRQRPMIVRPPNAGGHARKIFSNRVSGDGGKRAHFVTIC